MYCVLVFPVSFTFIAVYCCYCIIMCIHLNTFLHIILKLKYRDKDFNL